MHRGARREPIFKKDAHCNLFLDLLCDITSLYEVEIHAYSLMPNHYHLLLRSRHGNLSRAMKHLNAAYTQRVNLMERWDGPIFRGRFRSQLVKEETSLPHVFAYIHLNPLKAGLITRLQSHGWTSHRAYIGRETAPTWLATYYFESVFDDAERLH
jgi:putative transposase